MPTVDQYIAGLTGVATLVAALATLLTVREMAKQRKSALKPDLISSHQYAYVFAEKPFLGMRYAWAKDRSRPPEGLQHSRYGITVLNVGTGAAKQLRSEWKLDLAIMVSHVNVLARSSSVPVSADIDPSTGEVRILWPDRVTGAYLVANQLDQDRGHLLPTSLDQIGHHIEVPSVYLTLIALQVALGQAARETVSQAGGLVRFPDALLLLNYMDVLGEQHRKQLNVAFELLGQC